MGGDGRGWEGREGEGGEEDLKRRGNGEGRQDKDKDKQQSQYLNAKVHVY